MADLNIILAGIVGSTAYGLNHADSDVDMLGVYQAPLKDVLGFADHLKTQSGNDPDWQAHEMGKFMKLCMSCNPTVSEMLWLPDELYAVRSPAGQALILNRSMFLSEKAFHSYGGYARQQFDRLKKAGNFDSDKKNDKAIEKHGRHLARLVIQGTELLQTGQIRVRLTAEESTYCREVGLQALAADFTEIDKLLDGFDELKDKPCALPVAPDWDGLNDLLADLRMAPYNGGRPFLFTG